MNLIIDWSHRTDLPAEPVSTSKARDFVCAHLAEHDLRHLVDDIRLVASELATNAMAHAQTPFSVTLAQTDGVCFSPSETAPARFRSEPCHRSWTPAAVD